MTFHRVAQATILVAGQLSIFCSCKKNHGLLHKVYIAKYEPERKETVMEQQIHITLQFELATGKVNLNEIVYRLNQLKNTLMLQILKLYCHGCFLSRRVFTVMARIV